MIVVSRVTDGILISTESSMWTSKTILLSQIVEKLFLETTSD